MDNIDPSIDPDSLAMDPDPPFLMHHAFPTADGSFVAVQDEISFEPGFEPVQLWDTVTLLRTDGIRIDDDDDPDVFDGDMPVNPAHNLEIRSDIDFDNDVNTDRLYVGWYKMGLQAWDFNANTGLLTTVLTDDFSADVYHQAQTENNDDVYDGAWGVRLEELSVMPQSGGASVDTIFAFVSDRNFGLIVTCLGDGTTVNDVTCPAAIDAPIEPEPPCFPPNAPQCNP